MAKVFGIIFFLWCLMPVLCFSQQDTTNTGDTITKEQLDFQLIVTAAKGDAATVLYLIGKGADVNAKANNGISALMYAAQNKYILVVKTLVANGADINYFPQFEVSALSSAVINNQFEIVKYLLRRGADINILNYKKITPLMYAAAYGYEPIVQLLLQQSADINKKDIYGNDALILSVMYNHPDVSELLLNYGANPNTCDNEKFTPLILASQNGQIWYFDMLKIFNADFTAINIDNYSALDMAVINNKPESITKLLESDSSGKLISTQPIKLAYLSGNSELITVLKKGGCKPYLLPLFDKISIGYGFDANFNDIMFGAAVGLLEARYNFMFTFSHFSRYWAKRVLVDYGNDIFMQFWERRSYLSLGIDKRVKLGGAGNKQLGISVGAKEFCTYGYYRGAIISPSISWIIVPTIGFYSGNKIGGISCSLEYVNFETEKVSPLRINTTAYFYIGIKRFKKIIKEPEW